MIDKEKIRNIKIACIRRKSCEAIKLVIDTELVALESVNASAKTVSTVKKSAPTKKGKGYFDELIDLMEKNLDDLVKIHEKGHKEYVEETRAEIKENCEKLQGDTLPFYMFMRKIVAGNKKMEKKFKEVLPSLGSDMKKGAWQKMPIEGKAPFITEHAMKTVDYAIGFLALIYTNNDVNKAKTLMDMIGEYDSIETDISKGDYQMEMDIKILQNAHDILALRPEGENE